jgi:hypothetical protein
MDPPARNRFDPAPDMDTQFHGEDPGEVGCQLPPAFDEVYTIPTGGKGSSTGPKTGLIPVTAIRFLSSDMATEVQWNDGTCAAGSRRLQVTPESDER